MLCTHFRAYTSSIQVSKPRWAAWLAFPYYLQGCQDIVGDSMEVEKAWTLAFTAYDQTA